ncbi:glycosyltransferase [Cryobacterium sp. Hh7]|uniref:glycosyltransferase n=1 Tax=Cryobacterium sp. Hh7 TaxID=1259159 RepID=UPI00106A7B04|nr:glycosyltransferase [Cryobacterium sp. Hh7]TFD51772.1 glycosyltransferase [Cryobacterium sp. Hh7]
MRDLTVDALGPSMKGRDDIFVSVVAVVGCQTSDVADFVRELDEDIRVRYSNFEILVVDNGMGPDELVLLREVLAQVACVRVLRLSRKFSTDGAIFAGLEAAIGDFLVVVDLEHDPVDVVAQVVDILRLGGNDIVQGISGVAIGGSWSSSLGRRLFYWYNRRYLNVDIPSRATHLTGLTRRAVNSLTATARSHRYMRHLMRHVGYRIVDFEYLPRLGPTRQRAVRSGAMEAIEMISSYSTHPLRVVTALGALAALFNLFYAVYVLAFTLFVGGVMEGWTTTSLQLSLMFFIISVVLAVQSEYVGRILTETRREPSYVIMEELESETLIADLHRRNVSA